MFDRVFFFSVKPRRGKGYLRVVVLDLISNSAWFDWEDYGTDLFRTDFLSVFSFLYLSSKMFKLICSSRSSQRNFRLEFLWSVVDTKLVLYSFIKFAPVRVILNARTFYDLVGEWKGQTLCDHLNWWKLGETKPSDVLVIRVTPIRVLWPEYEILYCPDNYCYYIHNGYFREEVRHGKYCQDKPNVCKRIVLPNTIPEVMESKEQCSRDIWDDMPPLLD